MTIKRQIQNKMSPAFQELNKRLEKTLHTALKIQASRNIPLVYRDKHCIRKNQFIHQYPDGKTFLIRQDRHTSKEVVIKQL
ncbi:hypothetical protein SAMN05192529_104172 [Arachidicoccus rhizosphaerae]|uniref:Uncharacterized protein n=1 Tax=Arachidicoccus rhizosphaerae TaxID=551991 RepID=A0A1H3X407_9BACT|nr:hypothetical protein SAMN05192529_104172 [Arachidicoccus rhizosphaerae]